MSRQAMELLLAYQWPGNVRELANVLERAVLLSSSREEITVSDLPPNILNKSYENESDQKLSSPTDSLRIEEVERTHIEKVLKLVGGNKSKAARLLGISRRKLYRKIARLRLN